MLGEAYQSFSPSDFTPHNAAAQLGPHRGTHRTLEIVHAQGWTYKRKGWAAMGGGVSDRAHKSLHIKFTPLSPFFL